jgi:nucleotide-binding universal stress UspA family protein
VTNVVNLRTARKRKARAQKEQAASESRVVHGRSKAEKLRDRTQAKGAAAFVEGHRRERTGGDKS